MAFTPITTAQIQVGEPTAKDIFQKTKDNFDDHETRISANEAAATNTFPIEFIVTGSGRVLDNASVLRVNYAITLTEVRLTCMNAGSAGTFEIDVLRAVGAGAYSTVLSGGNITLTSASGDRASAVQSGLAITSLAANDFLRLDIKDTQTGARDFLVTISYTVT